eukprot:5908494-Ditylum_brightwellii.AAC.1
MGEEYIIDVPFNILKKDHPIALARYIKEYVVDASRKDGVYNTWATKILKQNGRDQDGQKDTEDKRVYERKDPKQRIR